MYVRPRHLRIEDLRLEAADLLLLDETVQAELSAYRTEEDWCRLLADTDEPVYVAEPKVMHAVLHDDGAVTLPYLPAASGHNGAIISREPFTSAAEFVARWTETYNGWRACFPPAGTLCRAHGDRAGTRLYNRPSLLARWCEPYGARG